MDKHKIEQRLELLQQERKEMKEKLYKLQNEREDIRKLKKEIRRLSNHIGFLKYRLK